MIRLLPLLAPLLTQAAPVLFAASVGAQDTTVLAEREDLSDSGVAFVEYALVRPEAFVGERVPVALRVGVETSALEERLLQLFVRRLDVPILVEADGWTDPLGARVPRAWDLGSAFDGPPHAFALNGEQATGHRVSSEEREGRSYTVIELRRDLVPERPGDVVLAPPTVSFSLATSFRETLLEGRVAADRQDAVVIGEHAALRVLPVPEAGRPRAYMPLVGQFQVNASIAPPRIAADEMFDLVLHVTGDGELDPWVPPRLELADFRVSGERDLPAQEGRRVAYSLAPRSDAVSEVPVIEIPYFDPAPPASYRVLRTLPLQVEVLPAPAPVAPEDPAGPADSAPASSSTADSPEAPSLSITRHVIPIALALAVGLALAVVVLLVRRRPGPAERTDRVPGAIEAFREAGAVEDGFPAALAVLLGAPAAAVPGPELRERLVAGGLRDDFASRAATLFEHLEAVRYGGAERGHLDDRVAAWVEDLGKL